jgi:hypothetical protein
VFFLNLATLEEENLAVRFPRAKFSANGEYLALQSALRRAPPLAEIEAKEKSNAEARLAAAKESGK